MLDIILVTLINAYATTSKWFLFSTNHKFIYIYLMYIGAFFILTFLFYFCLYTILKLHKNVFSLLAFQLFMLIFCLYLRSMYLMPTLCAKPFYLSNLHVLSYYRYLLLSIMVIVFLIAWCLSFYISGIKRFLDLISYPYMKEEIRTILYVWNNTLFAPLCYYFYKKLNASATFSRVFFIIHFILFYVIRIITACLLLNFTLFNGDLRLLFYLIPLLFILWLLSFLDYYFKIFREGTKNYLQELLHVYYNNEMTPLEIERGVIYSEASNFVFTMLPSAEKEGFTLNDLEFLKSKWFLSSCICGKFSFYYKYLTRVNYFIVIFISFCWFFLSYKFFYPDSSIVLLNFSLLMRRKLIPSNILRAPRELWFVKEGHPMNKIKIETNGAVSPGHPVIGEIEGIKFRIDAAMTHGAGTAPNLSYPVSPTGVPPDVTPVNIIPVKNGPVLVDPNHIQATPVTGSKQFCEQHKSTIENILKQHSKDSSGNDSSGT